MKVIRQSLKKCCIQARDKLDELIETFDDDNFITCDPTEFIDDITFVNMRVARIVFYTVNTDDYCFYRSADDKQDDDEERGEE